MGGITFDECYLQMTLFVGVMSDADVVDAINDLPALGVVSAKGLSGEVLVPAASVDVVVDLLHVGLLGVLLQVGDIVRGVAALQYCVGSRRLL